MHAQRLIVALLVGLLAAEIPVVAQTSGQARPRETRRNRPTPPARDPNSPGFVAARELPDGEVPPADADGNFIIGPTHTPAPEAVVQEGVPQGKVHQLTMKSRTARFIPASPATPIRGARPTPTTRPSSS